MKKILYLPCRSVPFDIQRVTGGLEAVQYNFVVNMSKVYDIDYVSFGDENFGDLKLNLISIDTPIGAKFTTAHAHKIKNKILELDLTQYDSIVIIEANKLALDSISKTPGASVRGIVQCWNNAVNVHKLGGKNIVPTNTFKDLANKVYSKMNTRIAAEVIDFEYWTENDIISTDFYPPILIDKLPVVKPSEGHIVQAQRYDVTFRKSNVAFKAMSQYSGHKFAFCPSKWAPPKSYRGLAWVCIDASRSWIQDEISTAKLLVNTCHNTGTVENCSLEAISQGVPVVQLIQKGFSHATFEYDPFTLRVEFEEGASVEELTALYLEALETFEDTDYKRFKRAEYLYKKFNTIEYYALWEKTLG